MELRQKLIISINSLSYFILAYLVVFFITNISQAVIASFFNISTVISNAKLLFFAVDGSWDFSSVKVIFITPPVILFITGTISLLLYCKIIDYNGHIKLLFIWMFFHSALFFSSDLIFGGLTQQGVGHLLTWMYFHDTGKLVVCLFSFGILYFLGKIFAKYFIFSGTIYFNKINKENEKFIYKYIFFIPVFIGEIFILTLNYPVVNIKDVSHLIVLLVFSFVIYSKLSGRKVYYIEYEKKKEVLFQHTPLIIMILLLFVVKIVFYYNYIRIH